MPDWARSGKRSGADENWLENITSGHLDVAKFVAFRPSFRELPPQPAIRLEMQPNFGFRQKMDSIKR